MPEAQNRGLVTEFIRNYRGRSLLHCYGGLKARLIRLFLVLAFVLFGVFTDLFGLGGITENFTYRAYSLLVAPFHDTAERDNVPVVMIDDRDLRSHDWIWPVSYQNHARVLDEILKYRPRSIYMDFLFIDQREDPTIGRLVPVLEKYIEAEIPVYLPVLPFKRQRAEIRDLTRTVLATRAQQGLNDEEYILRKVTRASRSNEGASKEDYEKRGFERTFPAFALYLHGCSRGDCGKSELKPSADDLRFESPLQIQWGIVPSEKNDFLKGCNYSAKQSVWDVSKKLLSTVMFESVAKAEEQCPYMPVISVTNLLHEGFSPSASAYVAKELSDRIAGKDVVYGQALVGVSDFVDPPTQPRVSSGYRHAMALENLRRDGDNYLKSKISISVPFLSEGAARSVTVTPETVFLVALVLLSTIHAFASFSTESFLQKDDRKLGRHLIVSLAAHGFYLSILLLLTIVQVWLFRLAPLNLLGLFGLIATVRGVSGSFYFEALERGLSRLLQLLTSVLRNQSIRGESI